jgi:hypothetical protein
MVAFLRPVFPVAAVVVIGISPWWKVAVLFVQLGEAACAVSIQMVEHGVVPSL